MIRTAAVITLAGAVLALGGCGDSCESVNDEIHEIGNEIQKDPGSALDRAGELEELKDKLVEMGCI